MHRRVALSLLGTILIAMLAVTAGQSRSTAGTVNIGWSGDKSGPTVASQAPALDGLRAYIKMTNDAGGVNGNKINLIEQDEAALAYTMTRAKIKSLKGVKVGIAGIQVASGQEWIDTLSKKVSAAGGTPVTQTLPSAIVNADVAAQAFQDAGVKIILMHHSIAGGIAMERSIAKYGMDVPASGSYGVTQDLLWTTAPYEATKNFVGVNCY